MHNKIVNFYWVSIRSCSYRKHDVNLVPVLKFGIKLKETKLVSLAGKYFSIPVKFRNYYPVVDKQLKELIEEKKSSLMGAMRKRAASNMPMSKKPCVGRPKKRRPPLRSVGNTPSILTFCSKIGNE